MERKTHQPYCPVASALNVIGEKWSLLIVRDLLAGPQRFTDLLRSVAGITPKWLTQRLRVLVEAGIVSRDEQPGRRDVWYRLTPKGRDLAPAVDALARWGVAYALRTPNADEPVQPLDPTVTLVAALNKRGVRVSRPRAWIVRCLDDISFTVAFDGSTWLLRHDVGAADLEIETTAHLWVTYLMAAPHERRSLLEQMRIVGEPDAAAEFNMTFGWRSSPAAE